MLTFKSIDNDLLGILISAVLYVKFTKQYTRKLSALHDKVDIKISLVVHKISLVFIRNFNSYFYCEFTIEMHYPFYTIVTMKFINRIFYGRTLP